MRVEELTGGHVDGPGVFSQPVADRAGDGQVNSGDDGDFVGGSSMTVRTLLLEQGTKQAREGFKRDGLQPKHDGQSCPTCPPQQTLVLRLTSVPLMLHWKLGSGAPSASHVRTLYLASSARCLVRLLMTGLPTAEGWS